MRPPVVLALAAPLASGLLLWAAVPPVGLGWFGWVALLPAAAAALRAPETRLGRAAVPLAVVVYLELLLVPALPFGLARDQWGDPVVPILVGDSPVLVVALVVVPLFGLLLYAVRFPTLVALGRVATLRGALVAVVVPAVVWTALDVLRTKFDPGGFWGPLYLSQASTGAAHAAALAGPWLLTFALVAVGYALAVALVARPRRTAFAPGGAVLVVVAAALGASALAGRADGGETLRVAAVQPGYDTAEWDQPATRYLRAAQRNLERASLDLARDLAPLTRDAAARGARVVVWPEATIWVDPHENARVRSELARLAAETDVVLVVPYFLRGPDHGAAVTVSADGSLSRPQPKQRPMWFLGEQSGNRVPPEPVATAAGRVGTLLGVDAQDAAVARRLAAAGADVLASATHDWEALAEQQRALARLHAAALARPLVRADWRYGSAIVAADGRLAVDAGVARRRVALVADVTLTGRTTAYARIGDAFGWACVAGAVLLGPLVLAARRRRSARERADAQGSAQPLAESKLASDPPP